MLQERPETRIPSQPFGFLNIFSWFACRWRDNVSYEGGMALVWMNGLLFVPLVFAAFFYPLQALGVAAVMLVLSFLVYEGCAIWRKRHPVHPDANRPTEGRPLRVSR